MRPALTTIVLLAAVSAATAGEPSAVQASSQAPLSDIIVSGLGGFDQPLRLRLVVSCDGVPWREHFQAAHRRRADALFAQLDIDDDGRLTAGEAKRLPPHLLRGFQRGGDVFVAFNFLILDSDRDGSATAAEFAQYLDPSSEAPLQLLQGELGPAARGRDLFRILDADGDGRLLDHEWSDVSQLLARDRDGNRVLTKDELQPPSATVFGPEFYAAPLSPNASNQPLSFQLAADGAQPADVVFVVRLSDATGMQAAAPIECRLSESAVQQGLQADASGEDVVVVQHGRRRIQLQLLPRVPRRDVKSRQALLRQFDAVDERSSGQVLRDNLPPALQDVFLVADKDADGNLTRVELNRCWERFVSADLAVQASYLRMIASAERGGVATLVDRNLDGRLSQRELTHLPQVIAAANSAAGPESNGLVREEVPTTVSLILQRGPFDGPPGPDLLLRAGPTWFFRADRNQDGDLDRHEFLGPPELFATLDANGDGWIELQEAVRGDTLFSAQ